AIATPAKGAQDVCDRLVEAGVSSILNFAPVVLQVPEHVEVRKVDLAVEMQILSFHVARRQQEEAELPGESLNDLGVSTDALATENVELAREKCEVVRP